MAGYTRQSAANIVDGANILAFHFNDEFDQLEAAFNAISGHAHDGTAGNGGPISGLGVAGTNEFIQIDSQNFGPNNTNAFINIRNFREIEALEKLSLGVGGTNLVITPSTAVFNSMSITSNATAGNSFKQFQVNDGQGTDIQMGGGSGIGIVGGNFSYNASSSDVDFSCRNFKVHASSNNTEIIKNVQIGNISDQKPGYFTDIYSYGTNSAITIGGSGGSIKFSNSPIIDSPSTDQLRIKDSSGQAEFLFSLSSQGRKFATDANIVFTDSSDQNKFIRWNSNSTPPQFRYNSQGNYWEFYFDGSSNLTFAIGKDFNNNAKVYFGNPSSSGPYLWYDSNNNKFKFNANNQDRWSLDTSGNLRIQGYLYENQFNV
jgi:hypothetical protein